MARVLKQPENDTDLITAIKLRDRKTFEALYKSYYKGLYTLSYRYAGRHEIAEEIVNDVFITIWNKASTITIESSMKNYLIRAVINSSLNYIKKEKNDSKRQEDYNIGQETIEDLSDRYDEEENLLVRLERALELLPPQCKKVMMMSRFDKMKQQEIAENLNISIKTVKNHLTYGFSKLRQALATGKALLMILIVSIAAIVLK